MAISTNTKSNIKINGKDYTTDEILKNVSDFFASPKDPNNPKAPNISLGFKEKLILNSILKSIGNKNLEGFFNKTLVAKLGDSDSSPKSPKPQKTPTLEPEIIKNAEVIETPNKNDYKPITVGTSPQIALVVILAITALITYIILSLI